MKQIKEEKTLKEYYKDKKIAENYIIKRFDKPERVILHKNQVKFVNQQLRKFDIQKILEVAPGPARLTANINSSGTILDSSKEMLRIAKKNLKLKGVEKNWELVCGDAFNTKIKKATISMIITFRFIRHFEYKDRKRIYQEFRRILKNDGYFIFEAPEKFTEKMLRGRKPYKIFDDFWTKKSLKIELENNGFEVIKLEENLKMPLLQALVSEVFTMLKLAKLGRKIIIVIDKLTPSNTINKPKEWLVLCQKK